MIIGRPSRTWISRTRFRHTEWLDFLGTPMMIGMWRSNMEIDVIENLRNAWGLFELLFDWGMRWLVVICFRIKSSYQSGVMNSKKLLATRMQSDRILCGWLRLQNIKIVRFFIIILNWHFISNYYWVVFFLVSPDAQKVNYRLPGFLSKFWELQHVMWTTNAGLTDRHTFDSRPDSWPLLRRGIVSWLVVIYFVFVVWWSLFCCRTFGSRIIVKFISLVTLWYGTQARCVSFYMS